LHEIGLGDWHYTDNHCYALYVYTYTKDVAYDAIFILLLSQIEVNVAIISAYASALRPLFNKAFMSTTHNRSHESGAGYGSGRNSNARSASARVSCTSRMEQQDWHFGIGHEALEGRD
jgi:hypothetical protein